MKFSADRLMKIKRLRRARRLYKRFPLFAYSFMLEDYPDYTYREFCEDLRRRTRSKRMRGKFTFRGYGRYNQMEKMLRLYRETGDIRFAISANRLRQRMTKPFVMEFKNKEGFFICHFSPLTPVSCLEQLQRDTKACGSLADMMELVKRFRSEGYVSHFGHEIKPIFFNKQTV
jgi:hypothetical protein